MLDEVSASHGHEVETQLYINERKRLQLKQKGESRLQQLLNHQNGSPGVSSGGRTEELAALDAEMRLNSSQPFTCPRASPGQVISPGCFYCIILRHPHFEVAKNRSMVSGM